MAHYAFIDENNVVVEIITGRDENEIVEGISDWENYYEELRPGWRCLRTSYNTKGGKHLTGGIPYRGNYAGIGYIYDESLDAFIPPQPFPSWVFDAETFSWLPPVPHPAEIGGWLWDEKSLSWVNVTDE